MSWQSQVQGVNNEWKWSVMNPQVVQVVQVVKVMEMTPPLSKLARLSSLVVLVLMIIVPVSSAAQVTQEEQVQNYIDRNTELLDTAYGIVSGVESLSPRQILSNAVDLHLESQRYLTEGRPAQALQMARKARDGIRMAVLNAREVMGKEERLLQLLERYTEQYGNLLDQAREAQDRRALDLLSRSQQMFDRAQQQYRQGNAQQALQLLDQADDLMTRGGRMLGGRRGDRLERELDQATLVVQRAQEALQGRDEPAAQDLLLESEQALERALEFRDQGRSARALQMAAMAGRLARRAQGLQRESGDPEAVQRQIERWDERVGALEGGLPAEEDLDKTARNLLERARNYRKLAEEELAAGKSVLALRQIQAAHDLLSRLENHTP